MRPIERRAEELGLIVSEKAIESGCPYLAERNTGSKLLICCEAVPVDLAYCFDLHECVRIE